MALNENYDDRLIAFLDILGFKELVERSRTDTEAFRSVRNALERLEGARARWQAMKLRWQGQDTDQTLRSHAFSDSVIISDLALGGAITLLGAVAETAFVLFTGGILTRGAIAHGQLSHTAAYAFGPALVEAYKLEGGAAKGPRIILVDGVLLVSSMERVSVDQGEPFRVTSYFVKDIDGLYFFDWLSLVVTQPRLFCPAEDRSTAEGLVHAGLEAGRASLVRQFRQAAQYDVRSKLGWFVSYFNRTVSQYDCVRDLIIEPTETGLMNLPGLATGNQPA